jgi:hypothetical protein
LTIVFPLCRLLVVAFPLKGIPNCTSCVTGGLILISIASWGLERKLGAKSPTAGIQTAFRKVDTGRLDLIALRRGQFEVGSGGASNPPCKISELSRLTQCQILPGSLVHQLSRSVRPRVLVRGDSSETFIGDEDVSDDSLSPSECGEKLNGLGLNRRAVRDVGSWSSASLFLLPLESLMVALQCTLPPQPSIASWRCSKPPFNTRRTPPKVHPPPHRDRQNPVIHALSVRRHTRIG